MHGGQYGKGLRYNVVRRRLSMADCLADNFFRVPPAATAALASPAELGQMDLTMEDAQASLPKRHHIAPPPLQALACMLVWVRLARLVPG